MVERRKVKPQSWSGCLVSGPCALGKRTFSAISSPLLLGILSSLATSEQGFPKQDRPKQHDMCPTNNPSEHQPHTVAALQGTLGVEVTACGAEMGGNQRQGLVRCIRFGDTKTTGRKKRETVSLERTKKEKKERKGKKKNPPKTKQQQKINLRLALGS